MGLYKNFCLFVVYFTRIELSTFFVPHEKIFSAKSLAATMIINQDFGINKKVTSGVGLEIRVGIEVRLELALGVESRGWVLGLGRVTRSVFRFVS